jgi:hypothetical protein
MDRRSYLQATTSRIQPLIKKIIPVVSKYWSRRWRYLDDFAGPNLARAFLSASTISTISLFRSRLDPNRLTDRICNHGEKERTRTSRLAAAAVICYNRGKRF